MSGSKVIANTLVTVASLGTVTPCIGAEPAGVVFPAADWQTAAPAAQGLDGAKVEEAMAHVAAICGTNGNAQTVLIRNGYLVWRGADIDNRHLVWSCTKSFMSTCLMLLWDDGKIDPSMPASRFDARLARDYPGVTIEHLATFTSGYAHQPDAPLEPAAPMYAPGAAFHYSSQSDLLALLLTRAAGEPLQDLFMRRVGAVIGLNATNFQWGVRATVDGLAVNGGSGAPGSGVEISARAMARVGWLFANDGVWDGRRLISHRAIAAATTPRVAATVPPHDPKAWYVNLPGCYGLNWWVNGMQPSGRRLWPSAPAHTFALQGNRNNLCIVVPEWKLVLVRLGDDKIIDVALFDGVLARLREGLAQP